MKQRSGMATKTRSLSPTPIRRYDGRRNSATGSSKHVDAVELQKQLQLMQKRENLASLRLAVKEKQLRDLMDENESMKRNANEQNKADCTMVDHAVGAMFTAMRNEIRKARKDARFADLELRAVKNGPESDEVKELAAQCRKLEKKNAELNEGINRIARLETLLAYSRKTAENLRKRCRDFDEILAERDEEIKRLHAELARAHEENTRLKRAALYGTDGSKQAQECETAAQHNAVMEHGDAVEDISGDTNENEDEIISVSSPDSVHAEMADENDMDQESRSGTDINTSEVVNVSSPELDVHAAMEPETISSDDDEQEENNTRLPAKMSTIVDDVVL